MFAQRRVINWNYTGTNHERQQWRQMENGKWQMENAECRATWSVNYSQVEQQSDKRLCRTHSQARSVCVCVLADNVLILLLGTQCNG